MIKRLRLRHRKSITLRYATGIHLLNFITLLIVKARLVLRNTRKYTCGLKGSAVDTAYARKESIETVLRIRSPSRGERKIERSIALDNKNDATVCEIPPLSFPLRV